MWKIEIEKVINGYILKGNFGNDEIQSILVEEPETEFGELEGMKNLLLQVKKYFGVFYDKHAERNLEIEIDGKKAWGG